MCVDTIKVRKKAKIRNRYKQVPHLTHDNVWESDKTQENFTYKRDKRPALSQQVITRLQETDMTVWQRPPRKKKDPQKKHRLRTVSQKITGGINIVLRLTI